MFERYTETARKVVFFGRYAASQFGGEYIDTEHLLLGVLRADPPLALRVFKGPNALASVRERIEKQAPHGEKTSVSVDLPLSQACKDVMKRAASEATRLHHGHIAPAHLLLGLLLEQKCSASKIITELGVTASQIEEVAEDPSQADGPGGSLDTGPVLVPSPIGRALTQAAMGEAYRDLTAAASAGTLSPLIGRESELESVIRILSRRTRCNPVLVGEPGVGKDALINGLAQCVADAAVPSSLAGRRIVGIDAGTLLSSAPKGKLPGICAQPNVILYVHGLFDLAGNNAGWGALEAIHLLESQLSESGPRTGLQCIATGTPLGFRQTAERAEGLARHFEVVPMLPPDEDETIRIVSGVKGQYEEFHGVSITAEAISTAVAASRWFFRHHQLPDRVIDLIDEAGASVSVRAEKEPHAIADVRQRIRTIVRDMEKAIGNHQFDIARACSDKEREERRQLERLRAELPEAPANNVVDAEDVVQAAAARAGVTPAALKSVMQVKNTALLELVSRELSSQIPLGGREWADALAAWLANSSPAEVEKAILAIRAAQAKLTPE